MNGYRQQIASDVDRDGLAIELIDTAGERVMEVFRYDSDDGALRFNSFGEISVPFDVAVDFIKSALEEFPLGSGSHRRRRLRDTWIIRVMAKTFKRSV